MSHEALSPQQFPDLEEWDEPLHADLSERARKSREFWEQEHKWPKEYLQEASHNEAFRSNLQHLLKHEGAPEHVEVARAWQAGQTPRRRKIMNVSTTPEWGKGWMGFKGTVKRYRVPREDIVGLGYHPEGEVFIRTHRAKELP